MFDAKHNTTITVSDVHGSRNYNISEALKKFFKYFTLFIIVVVGISFILVKYLYSELNNIQDRNDVLFSKFTHLLASNNNLNTDIKKRTKELLSLNDKIQNVEELIGITNNSENEAYSKRIDSALLTFVEKKYMLTVIPSGYPLAKNKITSQYGWRIHPVTKTRDFHPGVDLRAKNRTNVYSTANGIIKYAGYNTKGYGYMVIISHNFGFETFYAHLSKLKVKIGDVVMQGDKIALSGNSGLSSGPHLHYEIRYAQKTLNPSRFFKWDMTHYEIFFKKVKRVKWNSLIKLIKQEITIFQQQSLLLGQESKVL